MQENKIITTPSGVKIELRSYITGGQMRALKNIFLDAFEITSSGETVEGKGVKGSLINKMEDEAIKMIVISVDGQTENVLDRVLNLPAEDYEVVVAEVNKISKGFSAEKKTN